MKRIFSILIMIFAIFNCSNVWCADEYDEDYEPVLYDGINEIYLSFEEPENIWNLNINNKMYTNSDVLAGSETNFYVSLRNFIEQYGGTIEWNSEDKTIDFTMNGVEYKIINTVEGCKINTMPRAFSVRYCKVLNKKTNEYVTDKDLTVIGVYTMNGNTYLNYLDFEHILKNAGCEYKLDFENKTLYVYKYYYTEEFVKSIIHKDMTYAKTVGILGKADYFELTEDKGCKIKYKIENGYVEITFSPYTEDSDMKIVDINVIKLQIGVNIMRKVLYSFVLIITVIFCQMNCFASGTKVYVDGNEVNNAIIEYEGKSYISINALINAIGGSVTIGDECVYINYADVTYALMKPDDLQENENDTPNFFNNLKFKVYSNP